MAEEDIVVQDDFSTEVATGSGNETKIGSTGWWSWTGPESKAINVDGSGALVLTETDGEEKFFDSVIREFDEVQLGDGEELHVTMNLTVRTGEHGRIVDSRDSLRVTLTDGETGVALYLPTGESQFVGFGETNKMLGSRVPPLALRRVTKPEQAMDVTMLVRRDGDALQAELVIGEESSKAKLSEVPAETLFRRLALTNGRGNFELVVDDVVIRRMATQE
jgi:hypothetical protein